MVKAVRRAILKRRLHTTERQLADLRGPMMHGVSHAAIRAEMLGCVRRRVQFELINLGELP